MRRFWKFNARQTVFKPDLDFIFINIKWQSESLIGEINGALGDSRIVLVFFLPHQESTMSSKIHILARELIMQLCLGFVASTWRLLWDCKVRSCSYSDAEPTASEVGDKRQVAQSV
jgi:hypothetical protein